jgi:hypothetical protein
LKKILYKEKLIEFRNKDFEMSQMAYEFVEWMDEKVNESGDLTFISEKFDRTRRFLFYNNIEISEHQAYINSWLLIKDLRISPIQHVMNILL